MKKKLRTTLEGLLILTALRGIFLLETKSQAAPMAPTLTPHPRSTEWKLLPRQKWELFDSILDKNTPVATLDKATKVRLNNLDGFIPQAIPASEPLPILGQIIGSRTESEYLFTHDLVYIRSKGQIQVGDTYGITDEPEVIKSSKSDRSGYSYLILGTVKITAVREELYLGKIMSVTSFVPRGTMLIATPQKVLEMLPVPGPSAIQGTLIFDHRFSTFTSAQYKEVFIDRGTVDGVKPGMIFRVFQHYDPSNEKKISSAELAVDGEIQVTQVTENISTGWIRNSATPISDNSPAVLMTDISELLKSDKHQILGSQLDSKSARSNSMDPLEELDRLDPVHSLGINEKKKLQQLEKWQGNPNGTPPVPQADLAPPASNSTPPGNSGIQSTALQGNPADSLGSLPPPSASGGTMDSAATLQPPPPSALSGSTDSMAALPPPPPALGGTADSSAALPPPPPALGGTTDSAAALPPPPPALDGTADSAAALPPPPPALDGNTNSAAASDSSLPPPPPMVPVNQNAAPLPPSAAATAPAAPNAAPAASAPVGADAMPPPPPEL